MKSHNGVMFWGTLFPLILFCGFLVLGGVIAIDLIF